ncbi:RNA 2',3'-cyclic phosphodiesterase [Lentibacillus cibarius]|uniref:RNA 2',3'-cyclic phosphodiesterase n=1 Tax=Lentibacillus cibarius TaxID=2583219 RepID=A0A549YM93_9BACI|nr:RNA 2',3'-cyclic phosphodiesterase [Lentibacillus cibarius]TRM12995.1 RNA 2',3'-cyclic phosphodiesterase [Lentibacillus cibarius]
MNLSHYFIAIPLPRFLKRLFAEWQSGLQKCLPYKQWTHLEDFHITLKFLGPVSQMQLYKLLDSLHAVEGIPAFRVHAQDLGTFGNPVKPRVLRVGVEKKEELLQLHHCVEGAATEAGFQRDSRTFAPHITLAKKWNGGKMNVNSWLEQYSGQHIFNVDQVVVYKIFPGRTPKYTAVETFDLSRRGTEWHS